jgi:hypothetical protein
MRHLLAIFGRVRWIAGSIALLAVAIVVAAIIVTHHHHHHCPQRGFARSC